MAPASIQAMHETSAGGAVAIYFGKSAFRGFGNIVQERCLDSSVSLLRWKKKPRLSGFISTDHLSSPETEAYTTHIANRILKSYSLKRPTDQPTFHILDLCTGTGCISLLLHAILAKRIPKCEILGIDIFPKAIALANQNLHHNVALGRLPQSTIKHVRFLQADIFSKNIFEKSKWDMVISNPPYISPNGFNKNTSRLVRNYEPRIALVPLCGGTSRTGLTAAKTDSSIGDAFYPTLLDIAEKSNACTLLVEVADLEQARRVATQAVGRCYWDKIEIWRDWPDMKFTSKTQINGATIDIIGEGNGRSILISKTRKGMSTDGV